MLRWPLCVRWEKNRYGRKYLHNYDNFLYDAWPTSIHTVKAWESKQESWIFLLWEVSNTIGFDFFFFTWVLSDMYHKDKGMFTYKRPDYFVSEILRKRTRSSLWKLCTFQSPVSSKHLPGAARQQLLKMHCHSLLRLSLLDMHQHALGVYPKLEPCVFKLS